MAFSPGSTGEINRRFFTVGYALIEKDNSWSGMELKTNRSLNLAIQS